MTANRLLGAPPSQQLAGPMMDGQLGDPPLRVGQLRVLPTAQPENKAPVDPVLTPPGVDRLGADPQISGHVGDRPARLDQIEHPAPELRRITTPAPPPSHGVCAPRSSTLRRNSGG